LSGLAGKYRLYFWIWCYFIRAKRFIISMGKEIKFVDFCFLTTCPVFQLVDWDIQKFKIYYQVANDGRQTHLEWFRPVASSISFWNNKHTGTLFSLPNRNAGKHNLNN